ncbi:MAG: XkdX family protein [Ruminococcaceae bacterium]|nr:XkdX family protein [Oscillospiraceae bacterium]
MTMSKYEKVKNYYDKGLWSVERVANAVVKGWITVDEFKEITGQDVNL